MGRKEKLAQNKNTATNCPKGPVVNSWNIYDIIKLFQWLMSIKIILKFGNYSQLTINFNQLSVIVFSEKYKKLLFRLALTAF